MARKWVKLWCNENKDNLTLEETGFWYHLLRLAGKSPMEGRICIAPDIGYTKRQLGQLMCCFPLKIGRLLNRFIELERIVVGNGGDIEIKNWSKYQSEYARTKPYYESTQKSTTKSTELSTPESTPQTKNKKENKKKEVEEESSGGSNIFSLYEQSIGMLAPIMVEELKLAEQTYSFNWIEDAFKEAIRLNKRNWKYINAILERWGREGRDVGGQKKQTKAESNPEEYFKRYGHLMKGRGDGKQIK